MSDEIQSHIFKIEELSRTIKCLNNDQECIFDKVSLN